MASEDRVPTEKTTPEDVSPNRGWRFWAIMTSMAVASLLAGLDATAVSTAMPSIIADLGASQGYMWIANSYLLTTTAFTPIFGQTANIFGRRAMTLLAISVFAIGSAIAGPAPNLGVLVVGRAVQGIGCAGINAMVEMVVCDLVPLRERGKFMGFIFAIYAISTTVGPLIGGAFSSYVTWRWIFYLNLPLAGLTLAMVVISLGALPKGSSMSTNSLKRVDFAGNALLVAAITSILIALTWGGGQQPWSSWRTILPLVLGLVGLPLFLLFETRVPEPTTPFRLFSNRTSLAGLWCAFVHNMLVFYILFVLPIYFQAVLRTSAFRSGVNILPTAAVCMPFTILSGGIMTKLGRYRPLLMVGFALFPIAIGLFTLLDQNSTTGYWAGIQIIGAVAIGVIIPVTLPTILTPLPESDVAVATATWAFMRGFGTIWGAAIPLAVFNSKTDALVAARLQGNETVNALLTNGGAYTLAAGGSLYSALDLDSNPALEAIVKGIYVDSLKLCWQVGLAFALFGVLLTFVAKEIPMRTELETEFGLVEESKKSDGDTEKQSASVSIS
ncbi:putative multidrug resistance protein fnx1 [Talaromyces proteolyticus]|uniref:Multidrug resistance protein fnx1 n=1 Tax=Talaromyces proteolyticus TaxID=1131652 RepID=A0AAD4KDJ9_9EURO|nr:putative multidrug resistance protein fnx1 [Talaromyces proteolyticus]KAH8689031.1 putative multidrug resistance protein fnx1 [Talaromyces proteolyticus]